MTEQIIYTLRPNGTSIWLPETLATAMGLVSGDHLTKEQYQSEDIQGLIRRRLLAEKTRAK